MERDGDQVELGANFAEFFGAMQFLSGSSQYQMARLLDIAPVTYTNWVKGRNLPWDGFDPRIAETFGISEESVEELRSRSKYAKEIEGKDPRSILLGAFALRIKEGPPLNKIEADLLRDLAKDSDRA